jgi:hypothetical protein
MLTSIADREYLVVAYLNISSILSSPVGVMLTDELDIPEELMDYIAELCAGKAQLCVTATWNDRAWPNLPRSFGLSGAISITLNDEQLHTIVSQGEFTTYKYRGIVIYSLTLIADQMGSLSVQLAAPAENLLLFATLPELMESNIDAFAGESSSLHASASGNSLLGKVDYTASGWLAARHTTSSRNLLEPYLAPFDDCIVAARFRDDVSALCVMEFSRSEDAGRAVKGFNFWLNQIDKYAGLLMGNGSPSSLFILDLFKQISGEQQGRIAVFTADINGEWIAEHLRELHSTDEEKEKSEEETQ